MAASKSEPSTNIDWDEHLEILIDVFRPFLLENLRASHLLCIISLENVRDKAASIHQKENAGFAQEAASDLLDAIKKSDEPGKWQMFMDALMEVDDNIIYQTLLGERSQNNEWLNDKANRRLIELFSKSIDNHLKLEHLLKKMIGCLILEEDVHQLQALIDSGKRREAHAVLLLRMHRHSSTWYQDFLGILCGDDHHIELAKKIDPEFCEKKGIQLEPEDEEGTQHQSSSVDPQQKPKAHQSSPQPSGLSSEQQGSGAPSLGVNLGNRASAEEKHFGAKSLPKVDPNEGDHQHMPVKAAEASCQCRCCAEMLRKVSSLESELAEIKALLYNIVGK